MECGQYNPLWPMAHLFPHETVRAGLELRASAVQPIHWGTYTLSHHDWFEPPAFARRFGAELGVRVLTPVMGEVVNKNCAAVAGLVEPADSELGAAACHPGRKGSD